MRSTPWLFRLASVGLLLALSVIVLGAYTRLQEAGLGCPDWPGCYGQFTAPTTATDLEQANAVYPHHPVDVAKAKTEMTHRYFAEGLGLLIAVFSLSALWQRRSLSLPVWLPCALITLVLFQGLLGMWTVTLQLWPIIVVLHLLGGFCTLGLLGMAFLYLHREKMPLYSFSPMAFFWSGLSLMILFIQIFLGGWTSANYAALICPDFPMCQGQWWPSTDFLHAFNIRGEMSTPARTAVHLAHRLGAVCTFIILGGLVHYFIHLKKAIHHARVRKIIQTFARLITLLLFIQIVLGIGNVVFFLPLPVAVAHNGVAALLFLTLIALNFSLYAMQRGRHG